MKSYELMPTHENLIDTYKQDMLGRNSDIRAFADILNSLSNCTSIALDGKWGSGKTFFVKQTKLFLDAHNIFYTTLNENDKNIFIRNDSDEDNYKPQVCVYYDAWENDNDQDPILSLVYSIMSDIDEGYKFDETNGFIEKTSAVLETISGRNINSTLDALKNKNLLDEIRKSKNIEKKIKEFLDEILQERGDRLVIFIDELDRCKPSYAVRLLERIKHYFTSERFTFVFSINTNELQHTIRKHYGNDFDATRYLDRFFDLKVSVPEVDLEKYYSSINFNTDYTYDLVCKSVMNYFHFSIREMGKYIRMTRIAAGEPTHDNKKYNFHFSDGQGKLFSLMYIVPIMLGLKVISFEKYDQFIMGNDCTCFIDILKTLNHLNLNNLLNTGETYDAKEKELKLVKVEDKLQEVYEAVFKPKEMYKTTVGQYCFNRNLKKQILQTVNLMSPYTKVDYEGDNT